MLPFLGRRLALAVVTILVATFLVSVSVELAPGNPIAFLTAGKQVTPETVQALEEHYRLDKSLIPRYFAWLGDVATGDFGQSTAYRRDVAGLLGTRLSTTLILVGLAALLTIAIGVAFGALAALRPGWIDSSILLGSTFAMSFPAFVSSLVLILIFAVNLGWFPTFGSGVGFADQLYHSLLPAVALATAAGAVVIRITRAAVAEEVQREHVMTAVGRGTRWGQVIRRHVLRNASIPIVTVGGLTIASLFSMSVVVEQAFELNGLGTLLVAAVEQNDFAVVQAVVLIYVVAFVLLNTIVDLMYAALDPRVRLSGGKR